MAVIVRPHFRETDEPSFADAMDAWPCPSWAERHYDGEGQYGLDGGWFPFIHDGGHQLRETGQEERLVARGQYKFI